MESLSTSTPQIFFKHNTNKSLSPSSTNQLWLPNKSAKINLGLILNPLLFTSTISLCSSDTQIDVVDSEDLKEDTYESNTVHVKFQLRKECLFGEQFLLVGEDPIIGLWDPARGIPLNWSEEHIWTAELDLPVGKSLLFKFILKRAEHDIFWQPGPDRILETWETKNTIVVSEDWENASIQKITEEPIKEMITCSDTYLNIAENISYPEIEELVNSVEQPMVNENEESIGTDNVSNLKEGTNANADEGTKGSLVAENIFDESAVITANKKLRGTQDTKLVGYVGEPVLVPGLTSLPDVGTGKGFFVNRENNSALDALSGTDEAEGPGLTPLPNVGREVLSINQESNNALDASTGSHVDPGMPELYENKEHEKQDVVCNQNKDIMVNKPREEECNSDLDEKNQLEEQYRRSDGQEAPREVWQNDFKWGRKTLNKFLTTLGFPLDQT